jgi:uncharacterized protein (TIGR01777 family)
METVLLSGASGFIGSALTEALQRDGHRVVRLGRGATADVRWNPESGAIDSGALARIAPDVVINLAGEPIAQRWSGDRKQRIRDSRVNGTRALATAIGGLSQRPRAMISGSAVGYYGTDRGDEILVEESSGGRDYLARVAREWEDATQPALDGGIRVATIRTGIVCGAGGGALAKMLPPFLAGVGGPLGDGRQWMSWISLTDTVRAIRFLAQTGRASGAFNLTGPQPLRNADFAKTLGAVLGRPSLIPAPAFALKLMFGEMAEATVLASQRVSPKKLTGAGFEFRHPHLEAALRFELRR